MLRLGPLVDSADLVMVVVSVCVDLMDAIELWEWEYGIAHRLVMQILSPVIECDMIAVLRRNTASKNLVGSWSC